MKIDHIAIYVNDLEKTKKFFEQFFNAKASTKYHNLKTNFCSYFLSFDEGARLEIMTRPNLNDLEKNFYHTGYTHIAFNVGSKDNVESLTKALQEANYKIISGPRTTGDGYYESCIIDVEGNQIEITI